MRLWRVVALEEHTLAHERGGALWFPRPLQAGGRHDNPDLYGCIYGSERPEGAVVEALAPFRGAGPLLGAMLIRAGRPLILAEIEFSAATPRSSIVPLSG